MAHKNPVVVSDDGKKHETLGSGGNEGISVVAHDSSLSGSGTDGSPLAVRVSGRSGNSLSVESDGLFAQAGGGGMDEVTTKGTSLTGSGTPDAPLAVVLDPNPANLLRDESGLLVMPQVTKAPVVEFIMDTATRQEVLDRFFLEHDKKQTEAKVIHWVDVTDPYANQSRMDFMVTTDYRSLGGSQYGQLGQCKSERPQPHPGILYADIL